MDAMFGPFSSFSCFASSGGNGSSNSFRPIVLFSGSLISEKYSLIVLGSVITPVKAEDAAVSGLHKNTLSSLVPDRPGKFLGVVLKLLRLVAGACLILIHPLQPAW